ncbi:MAG: hypothetical protein NDJ90_07150 [Oligoflexia bacterium]|nr:hypothetical protein [Oligoflexia bacterium]
MGSKTVTFVRPTLRFSSGLPSPGRFGKSAILIHDRAISRHLKGFSAWVAKFPAAYGVEGGEALKDLNAFPAHMTRILALADRFSAKDLTIVVAGGGSVGDFGGFVASILKRGVQLVQIPSTWLSAIDSAHGGKTALNLGTVKNQIGTYYSAREVHLVRSVLLAQGPDRIRDALGELAKIALIDGGRRWAGLAKGNDTGAALLWKWLPEAIDAKYRVVVRDPYEQKRIRQVLNLGHTLGHILEAHYRLSHGVAVAQGLLFAVEWSRKKRLLSETAYEPVAELLYGRCGFRSLAGTPGFRPIPLRRFLALARSDKKRFSATRVTFIFLRKPGQTRLENVEIEAFAAEARAQGWLA